MSSELRAQGADVAVARLEISPGNHLALFAGAGIERADRQIKADGDGSAGFAFVADADPDPDLEGLSCRWEPLQTERGRMVNLLIRARSGDTAAAAALYGAVVDDLDAILSADPLAGRPARAGNLRFRWPPRGLGAEAAMTRGSKPRWRRYFEILLESLV
jgi:hypothetical protein